MEMDTSSDQEIFSQIYSPCIPKISRALSASSTETSDSASGSSGMRTPDPFHSPPASKPSSILTITLSSDSSEDEAETRASSSMKLRNKPKPRSLVVSSSASDSSVNENKATNCNGLSRGKPRIVSLRLLRPSDSSSDEDEKFEKSAASTALANGSEKQRRVPSRTRIGPLSAINKKTSAKVISPAKPRTLPLLTSALASSDSSTGDDGDEEDDETNETSSVVDFFQKPKTLSPAPSSTSDLGSLNGSVISAHFSVSPVGAQSVISSSSAPVTPVLPTSSNNQLPAGQYQLESIVDYKKDSRGKEEYRVKWLNWDSEYNTWEPPENVVNCEGALIDFYLARKQEIANQPEYAETSNSQNGQKRQRIKLDLPPDPRPIKLIASEFYKRYAPPTEDEVQKLEVSWRSKKAEELVAMAALDCGKKKKGSQSQVTRISSFIWPMDKIASTLAKVERSKAMPASELTKLQTQLMYYNFEKMQMNLNYQLKRWEEEINEISKGDPIIKIENVVDFVGPPENFTFITGYSPGPGIYINSDPPVGCDCGGEGNSCFTNQDQCCGAQAGSEFAYSLTGKLRVPLRTPIYECNSRCGCGPTCPNRVVQNGSKNLNLCIYRTSSGMGWGVKTMKNIKRGTFVSLYAGEVISSAEAERRTTECTDDGYTYLFDLDFNEQDTNNSCPFIVDAAKYGNVSHFINHSCEPNLAVFPVWINCLDPNLPQLALFTIKEITHGQELFFDYANGNAKREEALSQNEWRKACLCGAKKCRQFIF